MMRAVALTKRFHGITAVDRVSFTLASGQIAALIGPNGAGKSTLFALLGGQQRPDGGQLYLTDPTGRERHATAFAPDRRQRLGLGRTFQQAAIWPALTVAEHLALATASPWSLGRLSLSPLAESLTAIAHQRGDELAHADIKRVELALVLAQRPRVVLLDEPSAGMGAVERDALFATVAAYGAATGAAVLFTEHDLGAVFAHATRLLVMDRGALIADGPPDEVRAQAAVQQAYLGPLAE